MDRSSELTFLTELMSSVVASPYSDFYRTLYRVPQGSTPNLRTFKDWSLVPSFGKESMLERPMRDYTYVPHADVEAVYYTSGTSGNPPVFCPRSPYPNSFAYRTQFHDFKGALLISVKAQHRGDDFLAGIGKESRSVNFDGKHLTACIRLAKASGVDSLAAHTFTLQAIGEEMKKVGMNKNIKLIDFVGETCSLMLYSYMRETFPNATIISYYGMSETEGAVGKPCRALSDEEPYPVYHVHPAYHVDLIDPVTEEPVEIAKDVEAEILITDREMPRAFPLVRYRPGDIVRVVDAQCKEHGQWTFTVLGKTASDFMLVPGGQLRADEIERVLRLYSTEVTDHFEMHRYDGGTPQKPAVEVVLHVQTLQPTDLGALAAKIQQELRVAPGRTYQSGVSEGIYAPLRCVPLVENAGKKHKRMFKHTTI